MRGLTMPGNDDKLNNILSAIRKKINSLISEKRTGKYNILLEIDMSQGGVGDVFLISNTKERILKKDT